MRAGVKNLIAQIRRLQSRMEMPGSLREAGIKPDSLHEKEEEIARGALKDRCMETNPRPVIEQDIREILKRAL